ncbi:DNA mismatch repair protein MutS [Paracoccus sediminis]|uniref:DNA mismatch repair protein MutS n=1 Tax=Paracoccus sediminis TaxID=1214787 RepID=A0A238VER6_9RHOB|nr:Smr/MutS family protein [Paracoccus sediminis]TBN51982.1 DNA mismatch repair protein MutS [Paracoccus sediminis]SNR32658.1 DNA-nicking endonuclease, Smr domain [Paracoccus sediminis]
MSRRRGLSPEDRELWSRVARSAIPLHPQRPVLPETAKARPGPSEPDRSPPLAAFGFKPFRVGQIPAPAGSAASVPMPSPAQRLAAQPLRMDAKVHRGMTRGKLAPEARLDLHGMTLAQAHPALIGFVLSCHTQGRRLVLVITGKGKGDHGPLPTRAGALRHQVPHWLHMPPLGGAVQQVAPAHYRHGGEGAYYVYLRRNG